MEVLPADGEGGRCCLEGGVLESQWPCAIPQILQTAAELQEQEWEYSMEASCIEIYNNQLRWVRNLPCLTAQS